MKISFIEELNKNLVSEEYKEECKKAGRLFSKSKEMNMEMNIEKITELEETIKNAQAQIEELKKEIEKPKFKYPELGDRVWYIDSFGEISHFDWIGTFFDKELFHQGGIFFTKEDCAFERERRKVITELEQFKEPEDRAWNDMDNLHYCLAYSYLDNNIVHGIRQFHRTDDIYFESEEILYKAVDCVGADRIKKYYLRVED